MYVTVMVTDEWDGGNNDEEEVAFPTMEQIQSAIERLDGERFSLVTLEAKDETHMAVGGGGSRYVVYTTFNNEAIHNLLAEGDPDEMITVFVGGQEGEYPANTIVDGKAALAAAKTFAQTGELDPGLSWEEQ